MGEWQHRSANPEPHSTFSLLWPCHADYCVPAGSLQTEHTSPGFVHTAPWSQHFKLLLMSCLLLVGIRSVPLDKILQSIYNCLLFIIIIPILSSFPFFYFLSSLTLRCLGCRPLECFFQLGLQKFVVDPLVLWSSFMKLCGHCLGNTVHHTALPGDLGSRAEGKVLDWNSGEPGFWPCPVPRRRRLEGVHTPSTSPLFHKFCSL